MNTTKHIRSSRSYLQATGAVAALYAVLLVLLPSGIGALERAQIIDGDTIRTEVNQEVCDATGTARCEDGDDSTDGSDDDDGMSPDDGANDGSGEDNGNSGGTDTDAAGDDGVNNGSDDGTEDGSSDTGNDDGSDDAAGGGVIGSRDVRISMVVDGATVISDDLSLPRVIAAPLSVTPTGGDEAFEVDPQSVLAQLIMLDEDTDDITITDLQYFASFEAFFVNCIDVAGEGDLCAGWQYRVNGEQPSVGMDSYELVYGDDVEVYYEPWDDGAAGDTGGTDDDTSGGSTSGSTGSSGGGGGGLLGAGDDDAVSGTEFDVPAALAYLEEMQEADGSFGSPMLTDWVVLGLVAGERVPASLLSYLTSDDVEDFTLTDHERRAMALMALGVSPYDGTDINHVAAIRSHFGGVQLGDPSLVNDDIFGLIVLTAAGYGADDKVVAAVLAFVMEEQATNGSWGSDVDLTAAAVQALAPYMDDVSGVSLALAKARMYLRLEQNDDGGFSNGFGDDESNPFTTSWVLQAVRALGEDPADWAVDDVNPVEYLTLVQEEDGAVGSMDDEDVVRTWATSYALPAVLGYTWADLMQPYTAPEPIVITIVPEDIMYAAVDTSAVSSTGEVEADVSSVQQGVAEAGTFLAQADTAAIETPAGDDGEMIDGDASEDSEATTTDSLMSAAEDQLAAAVESTEDSSDLWRIILLLVGAALVVLGVFSWRKA